MEVKMEGEKCNTKHCRGEPELNYLGEWLCEKCWNSLHHQNKEGKEKPNDATTESRG